MEEINKITWKYDGVSGECALTGGTTGWVASSEFGSIRCTPYYKPFGASLDLVVWNKILSKFFRL